MSTKLNGKVAVVTGASKGIGENSVREVTELIKPYPAEDMRAYRVSTVVSNSRNDVPECTEPVE